MALIELETQIRAPLERVFDLSRSIDAHTFSASDSDEKAVAGTTSGLIGLGETVTWEARHFGITQRLTVEIVEFDRPTRFVDQMVSGAFASMRHTHCFDNDGSMTIAKDKFQFSAPFGLLGRLVERLFLTRYMTRFLLRRNQALKDLAESGEWQRFLSTGTEQVGAGQPEKRSQSIDLPD